MLQKNKMVKARKAVEYLYDGVLTITEHQKKKRENKSIGFEDVIVHENIPCRLSYKTVTNTSQNENGASNLVQTIKVFLAPEIQVKPGSKLTITQNGVTNDYCSTGQPAFYVTHQEIHLELFKEWA